MTDTQLIADLKETKRILVERGRCTVSLETVQGKVCLDMAVAKATGVAAYHLSGEPSNQATYEALRSKPRPKAVVNALVDQMPDFYRKWFFSTPTEPFKAVWSFNDSHTTTDQDCFDLIDKALAQAGGLG